MHVAELWRYPVKSMAGERLDRIALGLDGIPGDRAVHVRDARGRVVTSRSRPGLLAHRATLGPDGEALVDGRPWRAPDVARDVAAAARDPEARLVASGGVERFDVLPLLVATDGAIAAFGYDARRLRPNLVVGGVAGLAEREWPGRLLRAGDALIGVRKRRARCIMTTFDPDTQEQDVEVLRHIHTAFGGELALDCWVVRPGTIAVGDEVVLADAH
jgi:uncharacterized protein YcbX